VDNKLFKVLTNLGLSENEAKVYLSSLSLGQTTILKIAKAGDLKRPTVYSIAESLIAKGLMRIEQKGWKMYYVAENPAKLEKILEQKRQVLKKSLPDFTALYNMEGDGGIIKYFEGIEAVKNIHEELLAEMKVREDYFVISDSAKWMSSDRKWFEGFVKRRAKMRLNNKLLLQDSEIAREYKKQEKANNMEIRILKNEAILSASLTITPHKLLIHHVVPPIMVMVIENKNIIRLHREMFGIMWDSIG